MKPHNTCSPMWLCRDTHFEEWGSKTFPNSRADRRSSSPVARSEINATLLKWAEWSPPAFTYILLKVKEGTPYSAQADRRQSKKKKWRTLQRGGGSLFSLRFENVKVWNQAQCPKTFHNDREGWPTSKAETQTYTIREGIQT